jgi:hypothetical protein
MVRFDTGGRVVEHIDYWDAAKQSYGHGVIAARA